MTTPTASAPVTPAKPKNHLALLFGGLMVTMLLASLNQTVLSTALPTIVGELDGVSAMTWVVTGYILASTITMPIYGRISDLFGRKPVLVAAIVLFIIGSVIGALAGNIDILIVARVVQGLGGGGLIILSQAAIADVVPARERGKYMGLMGAVFAVSSVAGPLLGGWLTEGPGWRWAFWMNIPLGILAIWSTVKFLNLPPRTRTERPRVDYLGMTLLAAATTTLVLVATWGGHQYDWASPQIVGLAVATVVLGVLVVIVENRAVHPVIPMSLFKDRDFTLTTVSSLMVGIAMFGAIGYMPTYLQMVTGADATEAGMLMIPMMGGLLLMSVISGRAVSKSGKYKAFPIVGSLVMAVGLGLLSTLTVDSPLVLLCAYLFVLGAGIGMVMQILTLIVQNAFPNRIVGTATAASNYFRQVGATLGSAVVGSVFASRLTTLILEKLAASGGGTGGDLNSFTPASVNALPDALRLPIVDSYNEALMPIFVFMVPLALISAVALAFLKPKALAESIQDDAVVEGLAEGQLLVGDLDTTPDAFDRPDEIDEHALSR
jgi:EmrB/QacA subfamily drug resistance transporter